MPVALTIAECFQRFDAKASWRAARRYWLALLLIGVSPLFMHPILSAPPAHRRLPAWKRPVIENLLLPGPSSLQHPSPLRPKFEPYATRSGVQLTYTARTRFNAPIPCTPNPAPNLRLRVAVRIASGFTVDDSGEMQFWPANRPEFGAAIAELGIATNGHGCEAASRHTALRARRR
jgi:hypothetical protein